MSGKLDALRAAAKNAAETESNSEETAQEAQASVAEAPEADEKVYHLFLSTIPSCKVFLPDGTPMIFREGKYWTDREKEIKYMQELANGRFNQHIYVDQNKLTITESELDLEQAIIKRERQRLERLLGDTLSDEQRKILAASSKSIKTVAAGSISQL